MSDPVDRAAADQLTAPAPETASPAPPVGLTGRVRSESSRRAKQAAAKVLDKVGDRAAHAMAGEIESLHREIAGLRNEIERLRRDAETEFTALRAELNDERAGDAPT